MGCSQNKMADREELENAERENSGERDKNDHRNNGDRYINYNSNSNNSYPNADVSMGQQSLRYDQKRGRRHPQRYLDRPHSLQQPEHVRPRLPLPHVTLPPMSDHRHRRKRGKSRSDDESPLSIIMASQVGGRPLLLPPNCGAPQPPPFGNYRIEDLLQHQKSLLTKVKRLSAGINQSAAELQTLIDQTVQKRSKANLSLAGF